ncbi:exported hypothetical protein [Gammaproteobacteria bacterium]
MRTMLKSPVTFVLAVGLTGFASATVLADEVCQKYGTISILGGEFIVQNNVWNSSTSQCVLVPDNNTASFTVSRSDHNTNTVASYPSIYKGCHWGNCTTNSGMPIPIGRIASAPFTWTVTPAPSGQWNIAAEAWFSPQKDSSAGYQNGAELMIWLDSNGMSPAGKQVGSASIGGASWEVWFSELNAERNWNYLAYRRKGVSSVSLDLNDFIKDAASRGYLKTTLFLHDFEAGTEIMSGGYGFVTNSFSFNLSLWSEPVGDLIGTPNYGYSLSALYDETPTKNVTESSTETVETPQTWTELNEAPGYLGVVFDGSTPVSGVRFYSYAQSWGWNHITKYKIMGQRGKDWIEIVPERATTGVLPGWEAVMFPEGHYDAIRVEYSNVSYGAAPRIGELEFATPSMPLDITKSGTGKGTVTGTQIPNDPGAPATTVLNCDANCSASSTNYDPHTNLNLNAIPACGSTFLGWDGACSGTGQCTVTMNESKRVTASFDGKISKIYLGYYGRCGDPGGFAYWCGRFAQAGGDLSGIITAFGSSEEYTSRFSGQSDSWLIDNLYANMFNRSVEPEGLDFYLSLLSQRREDWTQSHGGDSTGATEYALSRIALDILNGASGSDLITLNNKVAACPAY